MGGVRHGRAADPDPDDLPDPDRTREPTSISDPAPEPVPIPMGVVSLEGHFVSVNRALARTLGRRRDELIELGPLAVTHPADRDQLVAMLGLMRAGSIDEAKFRQRWLYAGNTPVETVVSGPVIHGEDGAPAAFAFTIETPSATGRTSDWDRLVANSRHGTAMVGADGRYLHVNDAYAAALGYAPSQLHGEPWLQTIPADCVHEVERAHADMLRQGSALLETLAARRDGSCFEAELELVVNAEADGRLSGHFCLLRDIAARKREELRRSELLRLSGLAQQEEDLEALAADAVRTVGEVLQTELASFFEVAPDAGALRLRAGIGWPQAQLGASVAWDPQRGLAAAPLLADVGVRASATALVGNASAPVGVLGVHTRRQRRFGPDEFGFLEGVASLLGAMARRERAERRLREARHDGLTGLPDATLFIERLEQAITSADPRSLTVCVLAVEPTPRAARLGRRSQADVMRSSAARIIARLGTEEFVGRLGDSAFGILLTSSDELTVAATARCLLRAVQSDSEPTVHATIGVAVASPGDDARELIGEADRARRRARDLGPDRFEFSERGEQPSDSVVRKLSDDVRGALRRDELRLRYQPVFDLSDRNILGLEVLLRWEHASRTVLPPEVFLPAARRTGAIVPIGRWVLEQSLRQLEQWNEHLADAAPLRLFVNFSTPELAAPSLVDTVAAALERARIPPEQLVLDVSDAGLIDVHGAAWRTVVALRELGTAVVLDQFGTPLSSLVQLEQLPIDMVKLDRSCVADVADGGHGRAVVAGAVGVAEATGLTVIACGVETERQAQALVSLGCRNAQGFLLAEPRAAGAVTKLLRWTGERGAREGS
jgi:PAS domain S-box-containing protein